MAELITYANQRRITIHREVPKGTKESKRSYVIAYNDNINDAMKNLSKATSFKVYMYMLGNVDNYHFALSTQDIADVCGMSKDTAKSAVNDLIEKGYLVLREKHSYDFYERPIDDGIPVEEEKKKFKVKGTVNEYIDLTYQELVNRVGSAEKAKILWDRN